MKDNTQKKTALPGAQLDLAKMPGHWVLARMGKRVLRPGGIELTRKMLASLQIGKLDVVVELAPGLGATAHLALKSEPASYTGIERNEAAALSVRAFLKGPRQQCRIGSAAQTGLNKDSATIVYGEAMLTMQSDSQKKAIVAEAFRVLKPGGRYGIHELGLTPDQITEEEKDLVKHDLSSTIRVGARPLTQSEWRSVLEAEGFLVETNTCAPMHLLEPQRLVSDEGMLGALRIALNVLSSPVARRRVFAMRRTFKKHSKLLCAVALTARKPLAVISS